MVLHRVSILVIYTDINPTWTCNEIQENEKQVRNTVKYYTIKFVYEGRIAVVHE